jgi:hypothetical protein
MANDSVPLRRLSDKVLAAFNQACDQRDVAVAELLVTALEMILTKQGGAQKIENRNDLEAIEAAFARIEALKQSGH